MSLNPPIKQKWSESHHKSWTREKWSDITSRQATIKLFDKLLAKKEVMILPAAVVHLRGPALPLYEMETPTHHELSHYLDTLLGSQLRLARMTVTESPFVSVLQKRLQILERMLYAVSKTYHVTSASDGSQVVPPRGEHPEPPTDTQAARSRTCRGTLIEIGVKTGLSVLFLILRQNWALSARLGTYSISNDVLGTIYDVIDKLPLSSLANEDELRDLDLGRNCLVEVTSFLRSAVQGSEVDTRGRRLCLEIGLAIARQRRALRYLLEWTELALSSVVADPQALISSDAIPKTLDALTTHPSVVSPVNTAQCSATQRDTRCEKQFGSNETDRRSPEENLVSLYGAIFDFMSEMSRLASVCVGEVVCEAAIMETVSDPNPPSAASEVYVWGSNSSHQLAVSEQPEKIKSPLIAPTFTEVQTVEAGQYCTFVLHTDGTVSACGKGSYGRLGLGDSDNQAQLQKVAFPGEPQTFQALSASRGSDGHTLALTVTGQLYSWGDGDYGKLGHGDTATQKYPKLIGALAGKVVRCVSAGYRHSAAITTDGLLYTWGEGDHGRLGHGDNSNKDVPTVVQGLADVGQVACGSSHTLVVSSDGQTIWSFGSGENGKLGHAGTDRVYKPKIVNNAGILQGVDVRKVACGSQHSMALSSTGQVYSWGCGPCLGHGTMETTCLRPRLLVDLAHTKSVDISCGDNHCLALSCDDEVYAWGTNSMGQCGLGHAQSPVTRPQKVPGLEGVAVRHVSAGTSHSAVWTGRRRIVGATSPSCVDLHEGTFKIIAKFLERFCANFDQEVPPAPFTHAQDHSRFVRACLSLLGSHLLAARKRGFSNALLGQQAAPLRTVLFNSMDTFTPREVQQAVSDTLSVSGFLLLPPLQERMELLHSLLPQAPGTLDSLSIGQRAQMNIVLVSFRDNECIAKVLGLDRPPLGVDGMRLAETLMKTILKNLVFHTHGELSRVDDAQTKPPPGGDSLALLNSLMTSLLNNLMSFCYMAFKFPDTSAQTIVVEGVSPVLHSYLQLMFPLSEKILERASLVLEQHPGNSVVRDRLRDILVSSPAGDTLSQVIHTLLLGAHNVRPLLPSLMSQLTHLDRLNQLLPAAAVLEEQEMGWPLYATPDTIDPSASPLPQPASSWCWLVDLERASSLLIGRCLGGMLNGSRMSNVEVTCSCFLKMRIFGNGLEDNDAVLDRKEFSALSTQLNYLLHLACDINGPVWLELREIAQHKDWDTCDVTDHSLDDASRMLFATLIKHCGLTGKVLEQTRLSANADLMKVCRTVFRVRMRLMNLSLGIASPRQPSTTNNPRETGEDDCPERGEDVKVTLAELCSAASDRCLFLLLKVRSSWTVDENLIVVPEDDVIPRDELASIPRTGSFPELTTLTDDPFEAPSVTSANEHGDHTAKSGPSVETLGDVKGALRRIRWQRERARHRSSSTDENEAARDQLSETIQEVTSFVCGDPQQRRTDEKEEPETSVCWEPSTVMTAMKLQQERAKVSPTTGRLVSLYKSLNKNHDWVVV